MEPQNTPVGIEILSAFYAWETEAQWDCFRGSLWQSTKEKSTSQWLDHLLNQLDSFQET